ncbi:MAG TPA: hypothetical protein VGC13_31250 [Longimicrobium sp.]|jgi:hypothetical protein|uniref:hypothetical protein n=1 Tax=Longimicrobium sp. TaxID=2029185 RepID=UPI002EDA7F3D
MDEDVVYRMIEAVPAGEHSDLVVEAEGVSFSAEVSEESRPMMVTALLMRTYPAIPRRAISYALEWCGGFLLGELRRYAGLPGVVAEGWVDRFIALKERSIDFALLANPALEAEDVWRLYARRIRFERNSWNGRLDLAAAAWDHSSFGSACTGRSDVVFDFVRLRLRDVLQGLVGAWKTNGQAPPAGFAEALLAAIAEYPEELGGPHTTLVPFLFDELGDRAGRVLARINVNYRGDLDTQYIVEAVAREWKERSTDQETLEMLLQHPSVGARRVLLVEPEELARMDEARRRLYTEIILPRLSRDRSRTIRAEAAALLAEPQ